MSHSASVGLRDQWERWAANRPSSPITCRFRSRPIVEALESRELLSTVTEYPIPSKAGSAYQIIPGPDGNLWFTENDPVSNSIGKITPSGQMTEFKLPTNPDFGGNPNGIVVGPDGNLWFTEQFGDRIRELTTSGQFTATYTAQSQQQLAGITVDSAGNVWVGSVLGGHITEITKGSSTVTTFTQPKAGWPKNLTVGPNGNVWFTDPFNTSVGQVTSSGQITEYSLSSVSIVADPEGIVNNPVTKSLWITEQFYGYIGEISSSGASIGQFKVPGNNPSPSSITVDSSGNLWFSETGNDAQIGELNPTTGQFTMYNLPTGAKTAGITARLSAATKRTD